MSKPKFEMTKHEIVEEPKRIKAKWTMEFLEDAGKIKPAKEMTEEEKEDEVIRRLKTKPSRHSDAEMKLAELLSSEIAKEIDAEVLREILKYGK